MADKEIKKTVPAQPTGTAKYTKDQLVKSKKFKADVDILWAMLEDGKTYTAADVQRIINDFKRKKVN